MNKRIQNILDVSMEIKRFLDEYVLYTEAWKKLTENKTKRKFIGMLGNNMEH